MPAEKKKQTFRAGTRARRIAKVVEMLRAGKKMG